MAYYSNAYHDRSSSLSKARVQSVFDPRVSTASYRPGVIGHDVNETDFEEDYSDFEEFSGRRSEDSGGKRSETTLSSFDELQTPDTQNNDFAGFNFQLPEIRQPSKSVEGPSGPHLFRMSQESTSREVDFYLSMSPPASPEEVKVQPPQPKRISQQTEHVPPRTSVPLRTWTPRQVAEWMYSIGFERSIIDTFFINDISGVTLIDLQYDDLKELGITSFGQRHRLWTEIRGLKESRLATPDEQPLFSPAAPPAEIYLDQLVVEEPKHCATPPSPEAEALSPTSARRRRRRHPDDIISPAESASIVAIEQLLPKPHHCAKGENCSKWQKQQRKLAKIATEFPNEMAQIIQSKQSPTESGLGGATSIVVPSIIASSDLLGPAKPNVRLEEDHLKKVQTRDPQENVRHFLDFQHVHEKEDPESPQYEMFPPLSPPKAQAPVKGLDNLPRLTIPLDPAAADAFSPARTAVPPRRGTTPITALDAQQRAMAHDMWRVGSPASEMDVPVTAIPLGPIERDASSSVPPDMRYGNHEIGMSISRSTSRSGQRGGPPISFNNFNYNFVPQHQNTYPPIRRSNSAAGHRRQPSITISQTVVEEPESAPTEIDDSDLTPTGEAPPEHLRDVNHHGYMKKRKTKMLRHEWQDAHFRLKGTQLAMHRDEEALSALEYIDVDDYAVAISANNSKFNSAMKRLHLNAKKKDLDPAAFAFQLMPAAERKGMMHAATGKTHHFAVKTATERIDWMRELMLCKARKDKGAEVKSFD